VMRNLFSSGTLAIPRQGALGSFNIAGPGT
jgi:hypothetical protein